jgi:uncharacterized protein YecA (UPF0149 family)/transcriptional regulator with XRE-family HTH domain
LSPVTFAINLYKEFGSVQSVGRNEPCPCGSGKKHKKCCGKNEVVSINQILEQEVTELQLEILHFAMTQYEWELHEIIDEQIDELAIPPEAEEVFIFNLTNWVVFSVPVDSGKTILELYIEKNYRSIKRPKLREIFQSWDTARPSVSRLVSREQDTILVEDVFSNESVKVKMLEKGRELENGSLVIGIIIPMGEESTFFTTFIDLHKSESDGAERNILALYEESGEEDPVQFMSENFPEVLETALFGPSEVNTDDLEWERPEYLLVAQKFENAIDQENYPKEFASVGLILWHKYCNIRQPRIKNPAIYAAALYYLVDEISFESVTQKELAGQYGVSSSSISSTYRDMEEVLSDYLEKLFEIDDFDDDEWEDEFVDWEYDYDDRIDGGIDEDHDDDSNPFGSSRFTMERHLREMERELEGKDFKDAEEINQYLNEENLQPGKVSAPLTDQDKAQELLFDAYETHGKKRRKLVEKALKLDPNNPDAYNILAEEAETFEGAQAMYYQGMIRGEKAFGEVFFRENNGHFWGIASTRSYMRSKFSYAQLLHQDSKLEDAIKHYKELLELNEMDNQGVRFSLFEVYVETNRIAKAKQLLERYPEEAISTNSLYNKLLLELLEHGPTSNAKNLLNEAMNQNKHVPDYLLSENPMPKESPAFFQLGDKSEAIIYVEQFGQLWSKKDKLLSWLKR